MDAHRVNIEIDERIWKRFRTLAIQEDTKVHMLFNEALATWLKWMMAAEIEERKQGKDIYVNNVKHHVVDDMTGLTSLMLEQLETQRIIEAWRREQIKYGKEQFWKNKKAQEKKLDGKQYRRGKYNRAGKEVVTI
jgi:hypothetical protein